MRSQGRSFVQFKDRDERARFVAFTQTMLDRWRYAENGRTFPALAEQTGVSMDQISKWLRGVSVPSKDSVEKLFKAGVFDENPESMTATKPWMSYEPDARALNQGKKKPSSTKSSAPKAPVEVAAPPIEFAAPNIHDAIASMQIPVAAKQRLSAIAALVEVGADVSIEITVRAR